MFPETIETNALVLARLSEANVDVLELYELFAASREDVSDVFEYVPQEPYASVYDARERLREADAAWDAGDAAQYAVYIAPGAAGDDPEDVDEAAALAGYTGLFPEWDRRTARLGFVLGKPYWGNGYAGECATALIGLAFDRLDLDVVALNHAEGNERSKRAIERVVDDVGGQYDGVLRNWRPVGDVIADHHRYTVTRAQYQRSLEGT